MRTLWAEEEHLQQQQQREEPDHGTDTDTEEVLESRLPWKGPRALTPPLSLAISRTRTAACLARDAARTTFSGAGTVSCP